MPKTFKIDQFLPFLTLECPPKHRAQNEWTIETKLMGLTNGMFLNAQPKDLSQKSKMPKWEPKMQKHCNLHWKISANQVLTEKLSKSRDELDSTSLNLLHRGWMEGQSTWTQLTGVSCLSLPGLCAEVLRNNWPNWNCRELTCSDDLTHTVISAECSNEWSFTMKKPA